MDSGNGVPVAGGFTGQAAPGHDGPPDERFAGMDGDGIVGPTESFTLALRADQLEEEAPALLLLAEWALWGKDERNTGYHVMHCSKGELAAADFSEIITRYGSGVKPSFPQYTVCWIPGPHGDPEYLAIGIHEVVESGSPGSAGRSQNVGGRLVEYVRLFCFRYVDVAEFAASYSDLVNAVVGIQLAAGDGRTGLIPVELSAGLEPLAGLETASHSDAERELAVDVALVLLTGSPVCVLDADGVPPGRRLAFIDLVLSLLPFGLRARLSASTWASTTLQNLNLRLYFSNAPREDGDRTNHVSWGRPGYVTITPGHEAARLYGEWLREARPGAIEELAQATAPVRFTEAEELRMLASLPRDKSIAETLEELSGKLRAADQPAVSAIVRRLKRYLASRQAPADRAVYRSLMLRRGLFRDHKLRGNVKASVYRALLVLGFALPLSYADYCEIEDSAGGQPGWTLRQVLLSQRLNVLAFVRAALAGPGVEWVRLRDELIAQNVRAVRLLDTLERDMDAIRPQHRRELIEFTLWYLRAHVNLSDQFQPPVDARTELFSHGYLTDLLSRAFPDDQAEQRRRLTEILLSVHGERLRPRHARAIFAAPRLYPGPAIEAAVKGLSRPWHWRFVEREAAAARLRYAGHGDDVSKLLQPANMSRFWPAPGSRPDTQFDLGKRVVAVVAGLALVVIVVLALYLLQQHGS